MNVDLIPLTIDYIEIVRNWRNSEFVSQYMYTGDKISEEQQLKWFNKISQEGNSRYWIILFRNEPVGLASITNIDLRNKKCFWAFYLGKEELQGAGVGAYVEYKVIDYAFSELGLNKICAEVLKHNEKVVKLHQRFGFVIEANYRQHIFKADKYEDVIGVALIKDDWENKKEQLSKLLKI